MLRPCAEQKCWVLRLFCCNNLCCAWLRLCGHVWLQKFATPEKQWILQTAALQLPSRTLPVSELSAPFQRLRQLGLCESFRRHMRTIDPKESEQIRPAKESPFRVDATKLYRRWSKNRIVRHLWSPPWLLESKLSFRFWRVLAGL